MGVFKNISGSVNSAKVFVTDKKKRTELINKLRKAIKSQKLIADRAYIELGRYYYNNMRDSSNPLTEEKCRDIDSAELKIEEARKHLAKIYNNETEEENEDNDTFDEAVENLISKEFPLDD